MRSARASSRSRQNAFSDAETAGGILAIDDDEIERPVPDHAGQIFVDGGAAGSADDVADEEDTQTSDLRKSNTFVLR